MFSRTHTYQWEWEEFIIEYMVLDACWAMAEQLFGLRSKAHKDRVKLLCAKFSIKLCNDFIDLDEMVRLRNALFHETRWYERPAGIQCW